MMRRGTFGCWYCGADHMSTGGTIADTGTTGYRHVERSRLSKGSSYSSWTACNRRGHTRCLGVRGEEVVDTRLLGRRTSKVRRTTGDSSSSCSWAGAVDSRLKQVMIASEVLQENAIMSSALLASDQRVLAQLLCTRRGGGSGSAPRSLENAGDVRRGEAQCIAESCKIAWISSTKVCGSKWSMTGKMRHAGQGHSDAEESKRPLWSGLESHPC